MSPKMPSRAALVTEIETLKARLRESEQALQAIGEGSVDSLVADTASGVRLFSVQGAETPFRLMVEAMHEGAATLTCDGDILYANSSFAGLLHRPLESLIGSSAHDLADGPDRARLAGMLAIGRAMPTKGEVALLTADGERITTQFSLSPLELPGTSAICLVATDISEHLQIQAELRQSHEELEARVSQRTAALKESEERFRLALKNAPVSVAAQDRDLHFIWAYNQRTVNLAEVIGKVDTDLFPPEDAAKLIELKRQVLETGAEVRKQLWITSGGRRVFLDLFLEPLKDEDGQIAGIGIATVDLTAMKLAEKALRESEERFRVLADAIPHLVWGTDASGVLDYLNQQAFEYGGVRLEDIAGLSWDSFIHPDDIEATLALFRRTIETGDPTEIEHRLRRADGEYRWHLTRGRCIRDDRGRIMRWIGSATDIHDQKLAEEKKAWLASFPELNPNPVAEIDLNGNFHYLNPAAHRAFPDLQERGREHPWLNGLETIIQDFREGKSQKITRDVCIGERYCQQTFSYVAKGQRLRIYGLDITERKRAEEALRAKEAELLLVADTTPILLTRLNRDMQYIFVNNACAEMFGRSREEIVGKPVVEILGKEALEAIRPYIEKVLQGESVEYEMEIPYQGIGKRFMRVAYLPERDAQGEVVGWIASVHDITERKRAEEEIRKASEELRAVNDELTRFNRAMVGRELRMIELKKEINELCISTGRPLRYPTESMLQGEK
jgi:PAS domain S-box-containing protein